jgi:Domain of unknown function (DUF4832)/Domain of unknown function (DUF4874)
MNRYTPYLLAIGGLAIMLVSGIGSHDAAEIARSTPEDLTSPPPTAPLPKIAKSTVASGKSIVTYTPTAAALLNPERGFHNNIDLMRGRDFSDVRRQGYTLARTYIPLDEFRDRPLSPAFLSQLNRQLQLVRTAKIKVIPRFSYNFPKDGQSVANSPDASLDLTVAHINQLKPLFAQNADVIAVMQAGFIGAWGEWHNSSSGLDRPPAKAKILTALLAATPTSRMVQVRYANDLKTNYPQALGATAAFRGSRQARTGFHNDCFLSNQHDAGTYQPDRSALQNYIGKIAPFVAVGGETCDVTPKEHRSDCETTELELARFHWSYLNTNFFVPDLDRWRQEGCYDRIGKNLGYRLQLVRSSFPVQVRRTSELNGRIVIKNVGYASPYNPRGLELIWRERQTGKVYRTPLLKPLSKTHDPRFWVPQAGEISVDIRTKLPRTAPAGVYELLLNLPDPMPKIANQPEYAIRLANEQTWEAKTGFNSLRRTVRIGK